MTDPTSLLGSLPRSLRWLAISAAALLLTGIFAVYRFPYDRLATTLSEQSEGLAGIRLQLEEIGPSLVPGSLGVIATNVRATLPRGETVVLPTVRIRPAISLGWLRGTPAMLLDVDGGGMGAVKGEVLLGARGGFDGRLSGVNLALLPLDRVAPNLSMEGRMDGYADFVTDDTGGPVGSLEFTAAQGSLSAQGLPIAVPFDSFEGAFSLGGEEFARIDKLALRGPMIDADAEGKVGHSPQPGAEPLAVTLDLNVKGQGLRPLLEQLGIRVGARGRTKLQITGTLSRPTFR